MDNNPTRNNVAVKPEPLPETTQSGLFVGAVPAPNHIRGTITAVGPDVEMVKVGDVVLYMPRRAVKDDACHIINEFDDIIYIENAG